MRMIVLSALLAVGLGFTATTGASAASIGSGLSTAQLNASLVDKTYWACRRVRVCHRGPYGGRICDWRRVCRHW